MKRSLLYFTLGLLLLLVAAGTPAAAADFSTVTVTSISPSSAPNNMVVTVTIRGDGFNEESSAVLSSCDSSNIIHGTVTKWSSTSLTVQFNLINVKPVTYAVTVNSPFYDIAGTYWPKNGGSLSNCFTVYQGTGTVVTTTTGTSGSTTTVRTTATTASSSGDGENSVFFETNPSGAEIWLNGEDLGTSTFTYYTDRDGTYEVVAKKTGYEDYEAKVTILSGQRVRFYGLLTQLSSTDPENTPANKSANSTPAPGKNTPMKNGTAIQKSTLKVPTPWGTDPPETEESPVDPALVLGAAGIAIGLVLRRRR
jgi:hypothetical protein